jgi:alkylation response protein AidB-like acyl-CoA dehydrogenase
MNQDFPFDINELIEDVFKVLTKEEKAERGDEYRAYLEEAAKVARNVMFPSWRRSAKEHVEYRDGKVFFPQYLEDAHKQLTQQLGVTALASPEEFGGLNAHLSIYFAVMEALAAGNMPLSMGYGLSSAAERLMRSYAPKLCDKWIRGIIDGSWTGTMCLTESHSGTALGDMQTKAEKQDDGSYHIKGQKIWISFGEHNMEGIDVIHIVLAKTPNAPSGVKGISIFAVPTVFEDGSKNGIQCIGIEENKMGLHASPTCMMAFGEGDVPAKGWVIGDECQGMSIMFEMMNEARVSVGLQGATTLNIARRFAEQYAEDRIQGVAIEDIKDPDAKRVPISDHSPVRRLLDRNKVMAKAMRMMVFDATRLEQKYHDTGTEYYMRVLEFMVPIIKGWCTEYSFSGTSECLQVLGGNGYMGEFPLQQYLRDCRISMIYEGTNEIQGMDLIGRQIPKNKGIRLKHAFSWLCHYRTLGKKAGVSPEALTLSRELQFQLGQVILCLPQVTHREATYHVTPILNAFGFLFGHAILCRYQPEMVDYFASEFLPGEIGKIEGIYQKLAKDMKLLPKAKAFVGAQALTHNIAP